MSDFRGYISFSNDETTKDDRDRVGSAFFGVGLKPVRVWCDVTAALAHSQRYITPEDRAERQPLEDPTGRVIVFEGYLFENESIVEELGLRSGTPDSQIVAAWIERYGFGALEKLRGDYSFAMWEPHKQRVHLVVAPMAMRILYWHSRPKGFWFATTVNGRVKVSQRAAQNVATLGLARLPRERAPASGRPRFS